MTKLDKILASEEKLASVIERIQSLPLRPDQSLKPEDTLDITLSEYLPSIYEHLPREHFDVFVQGLELRLFINAQFRSQYSNTPNFDFTETENLTIDLRNYLKTLSSAIDESEGFSLGLEAMKSCIHMFDGKAFGEYQQLTKDLLGYISLNVEKVKNTWPHIDLGAEDKEHVRTFIASCSGVNPPSLYFFLDTLPDVIEKARNKNYTSELSSLISLLPTLHQESFVAKEMIRSLDSTVEFLRDKNKPDLYTQMIEVAKTIKPEFANNLAFFRFKEFHLLFEAYTAMDILDKFFDVFTYSISFLNDASKERNQVSTTHFFDFSMEFFYYFPHIHSIHKEKSFDIFSSLFENLRGGIPLYTIMPAVDAYYGEYSDIVNFSQWLDMINMTSPNLGGDLFTDFAIKSLSIMGNGYTLFEFNRIASPRLGIYNIVEVPLLDDILRSSLSDEEKIRQVEYYTVLRPAIIETAMKNKGLDKEGKWIKKFVEQHNFDYDTFLNWLDPFSKEASSIIQKRESFTKTKICKENVFEYNASQKAYEDLFNFIFQLSFLFQEGYDLSVSSELRSCIPQFDHTIQYLKNVINADAKLEEKQLFIQKLRDHVDLLPFYPPKNLHFEPWLQKAEIKADTYFKDKGVSVIVPRETTIKLVNSAERNNALEDLLFLAQKEGNLSKNKFILGKEYSLSKVLPVTSNAEATYATEMLLYSLLSRDLSKKNQASHFFGAHYVTSARAYLKGTHMPPSKFYHSHKNIIDSFISEKDVTVRTALGQKIHSHLLKTYFPGESPYLKRNTKNNAILDLLLFIERLYTSEPFDSLAMKMQEGSFQDIYDSQGKTHCCAIFSDGRKSNQLSALYYTLDTEIAMLQFLPVSNNTYHSPLGFAVLSNVESKESSSVLLVDSVEGGHLLRNLNKDLFFPQVMQSIAGIAEDNDSSYIMFNTNVRSNFSIVFNNYLRQASGLQKSEEQLTKIPDGFPRSSKRFLEAFQDKDKLSGSVRGYMLTKEMLYDLAQK